eukprot:scaffold233425_cov17-Tisochrysis_lutea.AAC.1
MAMSPLRDLHMQGLPLPNKVHQDACMSIRDDSACHEPDDSTCMQLNDPAACLQVLDSLKEQISSLVSLLEVLLGYKPLSVPLACHLGLCTGLMGSGLQGLS